MNIRSFMSLALISFTALFGACSSVKMLPTGSFAIATTVGDTWDRSSTFVGEYDCPTDEQGNPKLGKCKVAGNATPPDRVHGQTVAGQVAVGMLGGTGAALVNGNTARSVADRGACKVGANCGTVFNNQLQSVAEAINTNKVDIGVNTPAKACAKTNSCGS